MAVANKSQWFEPSRIDYRTLSSGLDYYESRGYYYTEVPWVVGHEATQATLPVGKMPTSVSYGDLVGSGEQSFIELLRRGHAITKACCITPCFRDEEVYDELHHAYFMKLELINTIAIQKNLHQMVDDARDFLQRYVDVEVISTGTDSYDIVDKHRQIELGSYGIRIVNKYTFIYGTGVALPRIEVAKG